MNIPYFVFKGCPGVPGKKEEKGDTGYPVTFCYFLLVRVWI